MLKEGLEGRIAIRLGLSGRTVKAVEVESTRPVLASRVLEGRPAEEALRWLPRLFSVCGTAHTCAGLAACEQALGLAPGPAQQAARSLLLLAETAQEHLGRVLLDWPAVNGEPPERAALAGLIAGRDRFKRALFDGGPWGLPGGAPLRPDAAALARAIDELEALLAEQVFGTAPGPWLASLSPAQNIDPLQAWAARRATAAARLLSKVLDAGWSALGRSDIAPLPALPAPRLERMLAADGCGAFAAAPSWDGRVYETGPLAREWDRLAALIRRHGNGLAARITARLVELAALPQRLQGLVQALDVPSAAPGPGQVSPGQVSEAGTGTGTGIGIVEAARGRLAHRVEIRGGRVARYQILAPTEWNFHRDGPLVRGLLGMDFEDLDELYRRVRLIVLALDPCVAYEVTVTDGA